MMVNLVRFICFLWKDLFWLVSKQIASEDYKRKLAALT
jgi:hypothetical protein